MHWIIRSSHCLQKTLSLMRSNLMSPKLSGLGIKVESNNLNNPNFLSWSPLHLMNFSSPLPSPHPMQKGTSHVLKHQSFSPTTITNNYVPWWWGSCEGQLSCTSLLQVPKLLQLVSFWLEYWMSPDFKQMYNLKGLLLYKSLLSYEIPR